MLHQELSATEIAGFTPKGPSEWLQANRRGHCADPGLLT